MIRMILGIGIIIAAFAFLFTFIQGPENNAFVAQTMTSLYCEDGEEIVQELGAYEDNFGSNSDGRPVNFYCENERGRQREVTGEVVILLAGGFAGPFIVGLLLLMWGFMAMIWKMMRGVTGNAVSSFGGAVMQPGTYYTSSSGQPVTTSTTFVTMDGKQVDPSQIPPEKLQQVQNVLNSLGVNASMMGAGSSGAPKLSGADLVAQLKQLEMQRIKI
jgi:hypothetical protein